MRRSIMALAALCAVMAGRVQAQDSDDMVLERGRQLTTWFYDGEADSLWAAMTDSFRERVGTAESLRDMMAMVATQAGMETDVVSENVYQHQSGAHEYRRIAAFDASTENIVVLWRVDDDGMIVSAGMRPESMAPPPPSE